MLVKRRFVPTPPAGDGSVCRIAFQVRSDYTTREIGRSHKRCGGGWGFNLKGTKVKCQRCEKPATFHITELTEPTGPRELHLCEDCARYYLQHGTLAEPKSGKVQGLGQHSFKMAQTAEELAQLDQRSCPVCGITFYEFRQMGRLGCPHDYICFGRELEPLLASIHGLTRHQGKVPKRGPMTTEKHTSLIRLRREMRMAVEQEEYERAGQLRDEIRRLEQEC